MEKDLSNIQPIGSQDQIVTANINDFFFLDALHQEVRIGDICMAHSISHGLTPVLIESIRFPVSRNITLDSYIMIEYMYDSKKISYYASYKVKDGHSRSLIRVNNPEFFFPTPLFKDVVRLKIGMSLPPFASQHKV